ncbi:hypothetical protein EOS_37785 [Caballeronia mineralivorans PML1(12)]|uniref:Uncharacterized protein n=1 Tax=Caballeronia mineralivorans PML1(12) TaxID=908627 RepID=A0A0J1CKE9_9BURK|nr:hypothetical protein EOS_37785 [Caballeronia mineralivorans PML1(12)]
MCFSSISPFLYKKFHAAGVTGVTTKRSRHADFRLHKTIDSLGPSTAGALYENHAEPADAAGKACIEGFGSLLAADEMVVIDHTRHAENS